MWHVWHCKSTSTSLNRTGYGVADRGMQTNWLPTSEGTPSWEVVAAPVPVMELLQAFLIIYCQVCSIGLFHAGVEHVFHYVCYSCANEGWLRKHSAASSSRNQQTCACCRKVFTRCIPITSQGVYLCFLFRATNQPAIP